MNKQKITRKLLWVHLEGLFLLLLIAGISYFSLRMNTESSRLINAEIEKLHSTAHLKLAISRLVMPANDYLIKSADPREKENFSLLAQDTEQLFEQLGALRFDQPEGYLYFNLAKEKFNKVKAVAEEIFAIAKPIGNPEAGRLMEEMDGLAESALGDLDKFERVALQEQAEVQKQIELLFQRSKIVLAIGIIIAFLAITVLCAFFLPRSIGQPITKLYQAAKSISQGNFSYRVHIRTGDELEDVAEAFNRIAEYLDESYIRLEERVAQRTQDLEAASKETLSKKEELQRANLELDKERLALLNLSEDLEKTNKELRETQAQLIQSSKMAAIGQLASGVAHEINNPLSGVLNNVQLIKMEIEEKKEFNPVDFKDILGTVEESALRCKKIIRSLLDFSRASIGQKQNISLNELIERTIALIEYEMKLENIIIQKELAAKLPKIGADPQLLQQVIFNLISNAKWAIEQKSGKAGGSITLKTAYEPKNESVCIYVSDTGIGIPQENLNRIFEPFFTTKDVGEGTGLGLSMAYRIIQEHKGTIEVESQLNQGATFKIILPAVQEESDG